MNAEANELVDIHGLLDIPQWGWWLIAAGTTIAVMTLLYLLLRRLKWKALEPEIEVADPWKVFNQTLDQLQHKIHSLNPRELVYAVNAALRSYLEAAWHEPVAEQTTEEFMQSLEKRTDLNPEFSKALKQYLMQSDLVKYAGQAFQDEEKESMLTNARLLANQARPKEEGRTA